MAVYTDVSFEELEGFLAAYALGEPHVFKGIAEGVSNSNYYLQTVKGAFILTLYEMRVDAVDLPFYLGLMEHLARAGIPCSTPVHAGNGDISGLLNGRPAAILTFLDGVSLRSPKTEHCRLGGRVLAELHDAGTSFRGRRANVLGPLGWRKLASDCASGADSVAEGLGSMIEEELATLEKAWPAQLPEGIIHADLFPDNAFFLGDRLSGLIDFYFACNDALAYDLAIALNAWCFESDHAFNMTKGQALLKGYQSARALEPAEREALPLLARGAALRFLLTRAYDWLHTDADALVSRKDPHEYLRRLKFHRSIRSASEYGLDEATAVQASPTRAANVDPKPHVVIYTDGGASPNPGPGGWGAVLIAGGVRKEICGGEASTTNNRMELMAAISALEALKKPSRVELHTDSQYVRNGIHSWIHGWKKNGWRTADLAEPGCKIASTRQFGELVAEEICNAAIQDEACSAIG